MTVQKLPADPGDATVVSWGGFFLGRNGGGEGVSE